MTKLISRGVPTVIFMAAMTVTASAQEPQCTTVADCAQKAMEAAYQAKLALEIAVPKGAVMAFNLQECPKGWSDFEALAGRVIVGLGKSDGLTDRMLGQIGGEEAHRLTIAELPSHNHDNGDFRYILKMDNYWTVAQGDTSSNEPNLIQAVPLNPAGGDQPHNLMQPFYVLKFCERK